MSFIDDITTMAKTPPAIENNLSGLRQQRGLSAAHLAEATGVTRQTIYAMEAGSYVPNTAVALKLARALDVKVEDLFALPDRIPAANPRAEQAQLLPGSSTPRAGQPVQLCRVDNRLMASSPSPIQWYFPASDAVVGSKRAKGGKTQVHVFQPEGEFQNRILIAGCDPGISVLARHVQSSGIELVLAHRNSSQALALLQQNCVHIAGTHLRDQASGESNLPEIARIFPKRSVAVISFAIWEEGIVTARGNPKSIRGIADFGRADVSIVNREKGAGSRILLDTHLKRLAIGVGRIRGYKHLAQGHLQAAWHVQSGDADACIATRAAARSLGLGFIPLISERYDLALRRSHLDLPAVQSLFETLSRSSFRRELESLGGYDTSASGQRWL